MNWLTSLFRRPVVITPVAVRAGDDLVLSPDSWDASQDVVAFLGAAQEQFPGVRLHLLIGFGGIQVVRKEDDADGSAGAEQGRQEPGQGTHDDTPVVVPPLAQAGSQGPVVVLRYGAGARVIATTVPP